MSSSGGRFGVIGTPIAHSLSPQIHQQFAAQRDIDLSYVAREVGPADFATFLSAGDWRGFNVTMPLKGLAFEAAAELSETARAAAAVNTMTRRADGRYIGDNTDGPGLITDLTGNLGISLAGRRMLMLGAGGAARGVARPLAAENPSEFVIANRTFSRAQAISDQVAATPAGLDELAGLGRFDVIIQASGAGYDRFPALPPSLADGQTFCYDLSYGSAAGPFLSWARDRGARAADGLGMLVEQAALSFRIWHGVKPDSAPVLEQLREEIISQGDGGHHAAFGKKPGAQGQR